MDRRYILIVLVIAAFTLGCVDKKQAETSGENPLGAPNESALTPPSALEEPPAPYEDIFGTYADMVVMDNISRDMDMQIVLSDEI